MLLRIILFLTNIILINLGFLISFLTRYGLSIPERSFLPYKNSFIFLTLIYMVVLAVFGVYKSRFKSSWELFQRIFLGLFLGTLLSVAFVYVFRIKLGAFPTSVFVISFFINLVLIFPFNRRILKAKRRIKKKVLAIGKGDISDIIGKRDEVETMRADEIEEIIKYKDIDEIVICEKIENKEHLNLLLYVVQKFKIGVVFSLSCYMQLLPERINGENTFSFLTTFFGRKSDDEEFLIRSLDIIGSLLTLIVIMPLLLLISVLIKITSPGAIFYTQKRAGKDGKTFTLYKFRTMVKDAEKSSGFSEALENDPRVTKVGFILRRLRLDELPQLLNVLKNEMSLVGPRPENLYRVGIHKALQGIRLAAKPGITGLAQVRSFYNLHPQHKIKYDYLYIQRRSLFLNLYILAKTIPVVFSKKGW